MSTKDLNYLFITYKVSSKKLESLIQRVLLYKTSHISTIRILDIYLQLIEMTNGSISQSFQFLLKQPAFFNLLSTNCPLNIIIKTLNLLKELVKCDDITKFLSTIKTNQENTVSTISELSNLLLMQQPSSDPDDIEHWFRLRREVVYILQKVFNSTSISELLLQQTCVKVLTPLQVMMYNECARLKDLDQKPFPAKRSEMIEESINACLELIYSILKCYGNTQRLNDDQYTTLVHRIEFARNTYDTNTIRSSSIKYNEISKIMDLLKLMHGGIQHGSDNNTMGTK
ncbi:hypothetical protein BDC45DRAFT_555190 [Circinella umbellata]|nr:hypothetical protein BDC45DRAFT_555190 [Circinella umbellata]